MVIPPRPDVRRDLFVAVLPALPGGSGRTNGADRASNDADVSIVPPKIPYGGFSPVRLQGRLSDEAFLPKRDQPRIAQFALILRALRAIVGSLLCVEAMRSVKHRRASGSAALPQGPSLRSGLCCPGPSSLTRPHPPHSPAHPRLRRRAAYTRCLRCAHADASGRPTSGSVLSLLVPSQHAALYDPGELSRRHGPRQSP